MLFTFEYLMGLFPEHEGKMEGTASINHVFTDSRKKKVNSLFVPLTGDRFDGHDFLVSAIENGAIASFWQIGKSLPEDIPAHFPIFYVENTLTALQQLAKAYRNMINPTVIGITGSNGKTTTKDLLNAVLQKRFITHATIGNFNNEIGMPLTILQMRPDTQMLILEMGMNHFHEIEFLAKLANPDKAIITNIGESHIEYLGSRTGIAKAKLEIVEGLRKEGELIIDADEPLLTEKNLDEKVVSCGFDRHADIRIGEVTIELDKTIFDLNEQRSFSIPLLGKHHAKNASYVIALAEKFGMNDVTIQSGFNELSHSAMRFEQLRGRNNVLLINDAYNASVTSMIAAIDVVKELKEFKKKVVVLGDILELGTQTKKMHTEVATAIDERIDYVYTYGNEAQQIAHTLKNENSGAVTHFTDKSQLKHVLQKHLDNETVILFKASRRMQFEQLVDACR